MRIDYEIILSLVIAIIFIVFGLCDVFRIKNRFAYTRKMEEQEREIWQRPFGVLELIMGVSEFVFVFWKGLNHLTSILLVVVILSAVCILGPYYHWKREHKNDPKK